MPSSFDLLWATDVHLDHLPLRHAPFEFGRALRGEQPKSRGAILSGDIGESDTLEIILEDFASGYAGPVYFVLGNHDYYGSSFRVVDERVAGLCRRNTNVHWLQHSTVLVSRSVRLIGVNGWYDAGNGDRGTDLEMTDFQRIADLSAAKNESRERLLQVCAQRARREARRLQDQLRSCADARSVVVVTHVPPFQKAAWHEGETSNDRWAPFFSSKVVGDVLLKSARARPELQHTVLCGHTHGRGVYQPLRNLVVYTGRARYGAPELAGILSIDAEGAGVRVQPI
jgi:Icc protein